MNTRKIALIALVAPAFVGGIASTACSDASALPGLDNIAEQCGLVCAAEGIVEGNAQISGIRSVDAFFNAVVDFNAKANLVSGNIEVQLGRIRAAVGASTNAELKAKLQAKLALYVTGNLKVVAQPPKCEVSASASVEATAKCDASVTPGMVSAKCSGSCTLDASATATCDAMATLKCSGTAPALNCMGVCKASCEGTCMLDGTAKCEGSCMGMTDATTGNCNGACMLSAGAQCNGSCTGQCKGECEYTPGNAMCTGGAQVKCEAKANAQVECKGRCEGTVTPPMAKVECQASAKASAEVNAECTPPKLDVQFAVKADLDATGKAEFEAFRAVFVDAYAQILAEKARAKIVIDAGTGLTTAAGVAVKGAVQAVIDTPKVDLKASIGAGCALKELPNVGMSISGSTKKLTDSVTAVAEVSTVVGG